jgi:phytanoyl-CoA hydroxylase
MIVLRKLSKEFLSRRICHCARSPRNGAICDPGGVISGDQLRAFGRDGFLVYGSLVGEHEAVEIGERLDELARSGSAALAARRIEGRTDGFDAEGAADPAVVAQLISPVEADPRVRAHATDPRVVGIVERILASDDIRILGNQALMKPAHHGSAVSWHQDSGYWAGFVHEIERPPIVTAWLAVDPVTEDNGCVRMIPGSHRAGPRPHTFHEDDVMRHLEGIDVSAAVPIVLPRGGVSFHHSCTVHGSGPNATPHRRRGLAVHYVRGDFSWSAAGPRPELPSVAALRL